MKITLELEFGKEFDMVPPAIVHDALVGVELNIKDKIVDKVMMLLRNSPKGTISEVEVSNVIYPHVNL